MIPGYILFFVSIVLLLVSGIVSVFFRPFIAVLVFCVLLFLYSLRKIRFNLKSPARIKAELEDRPRRAGNYEVEIDIDQLKDKKPEPVQHAMTKQRCRKCGNFILAGHNFCSICGTKV